MFDPSQIITVTFPGFGANRSQMAKYAGPHGLTVLRRRRSSSHAPNPESFERAATNGALTEQKNDEDEVWYHAVSPTAPLILHNIFPSYEIVEIQEGCWWNPVDLVTMGLSRATAWWFGIQNVPTRCINLRAVNMGGHKDRADCLAEIGRAIHAIQKEETELGQPSKKRLVLFGCSRGGATMFYTVVNLLPDAWKRYVALVVLEAPFDTVPHVTDASSWVPSLARFLLRTIGDYDGDEVYRIQEPPPVAVVNYSQGATEQLTKRKLPFVFITSDADSRVPKECTLALMDMLKKERGEEVVVEHLALKYSRHSSMSCGNVEDRDRYVSFMNEMYAKYLPSA